MTGGIRSSYKSKYSVSLFELLKSYSNHVMRKNFLSINIPKLPVCTAEQGMDIIKISLNKLNDWKDLFGLIPVKFKKTYNLKKSGIAGLFAAALELTREGLITILQKKTFGKLLIKEIRVNKITIRSIIKEEKIRCRCLYERYDRWY